MSNQYHPQFPDNEGKNESYQAEGASGATGATGAYGANGTYGANGANGTSVPQQAQTPQTTQQTQQPQQTQQTQQPQQPQRRPLSPQPFLPKKGNYQELLFYKKAVIIYDLSFYFAHHYFVPHRDRTVDQVIQAARSAKQNITEGSAASTTSSETEIKLLGVARASMQEVLEDYIDYLRTRGLSQWTADDPRTLKTKEYCRTHTDPADYTKDIEKRSAEALCNIAITLIHQYDHLIAKYLDSIQREFVERGGIRERMTAARLGYRNDQKSRIAELEAENAQLRAEVARLEAILEKKGGAQ